MKNELIKTDHSADVLIIGSGGAGLRAATHLADYGLKVIIMSKVPPLSSQTTAAQGGINAVFASNEEDSWRWHMYDTIKAGDWLVDQDAAELLCKNAGEAINSLIELGVEFNRNPVTGKLDQKPYGGQSTHYGSGILARRACHAADRTGKAIMETLYQAALSKSNIYFLSNHFALDLLMEGGICKGVECINTTSLEREIVLSGSTVIATGGAGQIYAASTSSSVCTGDGSGLAARAGLPLQDMEFVQFHPTAISGLGVLVSEAARSAGGKLMNCRGERFMAKYAPKFMELASRDVITRSIATEINAGLGCGVNKDHVFLDITHLSAAQIHAELPNLFENCRNILNIDPSKDLIPVAPAAHYNMGGIPTDINCRVVGGGNLYSIGEAACISVHGANRLGCNSLLDLFVFAKICADDIVHNKPSPCEPPPSLRASLSSLRAIALQSSMAHSAMNYNILDRHGSCAPRDDDKTLESYKQRLRLTMQQNVGVFRDATSLKSAIEEIANLQRRYLDINQTSSLIEYLELGNMLLSAESVAHSALWREESRGAHWRSDFRDRRDDAFLSHAIYDFRTKSCSKREVRKVAGDAEIFQPKQRTY